MADETPPPPGASGQPERRRPATTIDLTATEIASRERADETLASESVGAAAAEPEPTASAAPQPPPDQDTAPKQGSLARSVGWPLVGAGLAGAFLALGVAWVVAWSTDRGSELAARIGQLDRQLSELTARAPADAANAARAGDLASRLQKLEAQVAALPAPDGRVAAMATQLKSLDETVGTLAQRSDRAAAANAAALKELTDKLTRSETSEAQSNASSTATADANAAALAALADRIGALEGTAKGTQDQLAAELAARKAERADDRALRTAVMAGALLATLERGDPFAAELDAAQRLAPDPKALAPLAGFAASGLPSAAALARELASLEPALQKVAGAPPPEGGFMEKLKANAERLVRIRPLEEVAGDDPPTVIARAQIKAGRGDVAGALAELGALPANVRAPAQAWIAKAQARESAIAASRAFATEALAALAPR
jgi:hypothetical protein